MNPDVFDDEFVLRIFDFPCSYTEADLVAAIKDIETEEYRLKWNSDSDAFLVFKSSSSARKIFLANIGSATFKILEYKVDDKRERPIKTDIVARRMVAGALGIKCMDNECPKLEKAIQDKKNLENKIKKRQQDLDKAWEE